MKEYGGYIEFATNQGQEYYSDLIKLNSGRNCLAYLIEARKIRKVYLPFFMCSAASEVCDRYHIEYEYYHINEKFIPIFEKELCKDEYIYIVNYYGQLDREEVINLQGKYGNIILDNVNAFFESPVYGIDTIYSCRKFFGVSDGAYLSTNAFSMCDYETDISHNRVHFLFGRYEENANKFYQEYVLNNKLFDNEPIKKMSKLTINLLKNIDYEYVKKRREENFRFVHGILGDKNELLVKMANGPYAYPLLVKNGDDMRKKLKEKNIYVPLLWPNVIETREINAIEYSFANNILPLPIDQRYDCNDMVHICNTVQELLSIS